MARRVFVHIGTMKSATTYVQALCDRNRCSLRKAGMLWTSAEDNFKAIDELLGIHRDRPGLDGAWESLSHRILAHEGDALISNELLAPINSRKIEYLLAELAPAQLHVIITARDLARVIPSQWQEGARNRHTVSWAEFLASVLGGDGSDDEIGRTFWRKHGIADLVSRWSQHVPLDRITVITVPPPGSSPTLIGERFASVIGIDPATLQQPHYINPSLGAHSAELLRRVNARSGDFDLLHYKWAFKHGLARFTLSRRASEEPKIALNADQLRWAQAKVMAMTAAIRDSGVRVVGDLGELVPRPPTAPATSDPTAITDADMLELAVEGLVGMGRMLANLRLEYDALLRELEQKLPPIQPAEQQEFTALLDGTDDTIPGIPRKGRFLRWRLSRSVPMSTGSHRLGSPD